MSEVKIPEGYKQTEVGVIPKDWEVEPLKSLLKEPPKYGINAAAVPLTGNLPVYIRITDISEDGYYSPEKVAGVNSPFSSSYILNEGDIVLARTGASVGKSYLYRKEDGTLIYAGFLIKVSPDKRLLNSKYLHQYLKTEQYWAWVIVNSMRSGQPGINGNEYGRLLIPLPSIEEQTAIATALSDVDNLIQSLEKLIAKKEAIKMGTMQQLLTGKTRLPEFATRDDGSPKGFKQTELGRIPEDWDYLTLDSMANVRGGKRLPKGKQLVKAQTKHPYIRVADMFMGGVDTTNMLYLTEDTAPLIKNYRIFSNELFISVAGTIGLIGKIPAELDKANLTENADRICNIQGDSSYLLYYLSSQKVQDKILSQITVGAQPKLAIQRINSLDILSPNSIEEQTAIATILADMDAEIQALQQRLEKTKDIKQGMMQQLLTGKVRLAH